MLRWILSVLLLVESTAVVSAASPESKEARDSTVAPDSSSTDVFRSAMAGIEIHKPKTWHFTNLQSVLENRASVKLKDEEFQKALQQMASAPLVAATKHSEPYDALNPSFQVLMRPAGQFEGKSGVFLLGMATPGLSQVFTNFHVTNPPHAITVGDRSAGCMVFTYTAKNHDGKEFPTMATLVMIPHEKALYQIGFSCPPEGPDKLTKEIDEVLTSVKWLD